MTAMVSVSRTYLVAVSQLTENRSPYFLGQIYQAIQGRAGNRCQRVHVVFLRTPTSPSYQPWYDINITNSCCLNLCYVPTKITYDIGTLEIRREQLECTGVRLHFGQEQRFLTIFPPSLPVICIFVLIF